MVPGRGSIYSLTVNYQRWLPGLEVPNAIVLVEFPEHPGVRGGRPARLSVTPLMMAPYLRAIPDPGA